MCLMYSSATLPLKYRLYNDPSMFLWLTSIIPLHCTGAWHSRHLINIYGKKEERKGGKGKEKRKKVGRKGEGRRGGKSIQSHDQSTILNPQNYQW